MENSAYQCFVVEENSKKCGHILVLMQEGEGEIISIYTNPQFRRQKVAKMLLNYVLNQVKNLFLEVRESNIPAITLYQKMGGKQVNIRPNYYKNPTENALVLHLSATY